MNPHKPFKAWGIPILKKTIQLVVTLFLLSLAVFYISRLAPGDPLRSYYGESVERMSDEERRLFLSLSDKQYQLTEEEFQQTFKTLKHKSEESDL